MYRNCNNILVTGGSSTYVARGSVVNIHTSRPDVSFLLFRQLKDHVAEGALHNSGEVSDHPKCHPGTRTAILEHLETWTRALTYIYPIIWLYGPAGSGKSSILRTIAQILFEQNLLLASFFFLRSAPGRNSSDRFIATFAYQLALSVPPTRPYIEAAIEENPLIFSLSLWDQAHALIVSPLLAWCRDNPTDEYRQKYPHVIIVDGLDECQDPNKQCKILQVLCRILRTLPIPVALLLASRPEHHIRSAFDLGNLNRASSRLALDDSYNPDADIKKYLNERFSQIEQHHRPYLPISPWPSPEVVDKLVTKASGQFIYPSTVVKFVGSLRHNPVKRLDMILGIIDAGKFRPFEELDLLYTMIFLDIDENDRVDVLRILGVLLVPYKEDHSGYRTPAFLEYLLNLDAGDTRRMLFDLESLLSVDSDHDPVRFSHASLGDYLFDRSRSGQFWIDAGKVYADLAGHYTIRLPECKELPSFKGFFHQNISFFFSNATPTLELRKAIESCDLATVMSLSWRSTSLGLFSDNTPMLLQAIRSSAFSDANQLFTDKLASYAKIIRPKIQFYFQVIALRHFLIATVVLLGVAPVDNHEFYFECLQSIFIRTQLSSEDKYGDESPRYQFDIPELTVVQVLKTLFEDNSVSSLGYFLDDNQYGDIAIYLVTFITHHSSDVVLPLVTVGKCMSTMLPIFLSKSPIRQDLLEKIKHTWPHLIDPSYLHFDSIKDALMTYVSRSGVRFCGKVGTF
ncbi:hypothetical protein GALMADRAFT_251694 [Galerina marginata CBS 339.88]|uniref:NACHT domain-containing protein n=1 Tax=Galerina marginata (strain CBS 339.88) TaxID=685588 RepID=A0A067SQA2_GALM3|nr:hypothetical protein GALMADRAFT_251694 [Galerina marginata CBS 339.88]